MNGSMPMIQTFIPELLEGLTALSGGGMSDIVICPPAVYVQKVRDQLQSSNYIKLGAQNSWYGEAGPFTGEISPQMLQEMGCQYVILGHSERRQLFFESDELIARKFVAAYHAGLIPIVCVGETESERAQGKALEVVSRQLSIVLDHASTKMLGQSLIAYEPVWAIGTGQTATPAEAEEVHAYLRQWIAKRDNEAAQKVRILYGGSIKASNAVQLFSEPNIDGGLVGGASLITQEFLNICQAV